MDEPGTATAGTATAGTATALEAEPVPHATPLVTGDTETSKQRSDDELNQQIAAAFSDIITHAHEVGQRIAAQFGLTLSDTKALFILEASMTMKELGQRMSCDPSFVTAVADALEKRGLARREPSQRDRRSKNLVLTPEGATLRERLCAELSAQAPWSTSLEVGERRCLLTLMKKMISCRGGR